MIRVLFVCTGNICRSPMVEAVFQDRVDRAGLSEQIQVDSAGTGSWHIGDRPHHGTLGVLKRVNIAYNGRARQITRADLDDFDYVLAMDRENLRHIQGMAPQGSAEISLFLDHARALGLTRHDEVPDPYFDNSFDRTYDLATKGAEALLAHIRATHGL